MDAANDWVTAPTAPTPAAERDDWVTAPAQHWAAPPGGEFGDLAAQSDAPAPEPGAVQRIIGAGVKGAVEGFGNPAGQTILSPEAQDWMDAKQREGGVGGFMAGLGSTAAKDIGTAGGVAAGIPNALFRGAQGAVAQTGAEVGAPQLGRDIAAIPEAFAGSPGMLEHSNGSQPSGAAVTARQIQARDGIGIMEAWSRAHAENTAAAASAITDIGEAPDIDGAIAAAGKAAQAPAPSSLADTLAEVDRLNAQPAEQPEAGAAPTGWSVDDRFGQGDAPSAAQPSAPSAVTAAQVQARDGLGYNEAARRADAENAPALQSVGAAASREQTPQSQLEMPPAEFAANRAQGEIERLAAPPQPNDRTIYIPETKPTLAEVTGDPVAAMDQAYNRQQPEAMTQHIEREGRNADAVANYYADTAGSAQDLLRMERARDATAAQNIHAVFGDPQSVRPPADPSPTIQLMDGMLSDPRQAERNSVVKILSSLSEKFYDDNGELKTDPYALYGIGEHINDLLRGTGDTETNSAARVLKRELMQIKGSLYNDIETAAPGFAQYRADYQRDSQAIDATQLLQDSRLSLLSGTHQHITPAKWFSFMRGIVEGRTDPMDPASALSENQMDRLWNITDQLKRSTFVDAGKPRGSWTSMMQEWGGRFGRLAAHGIAASTFPVVGNLGVEMGVAGLRKRSVGREMNRVLNPDLGQQAP